MSTRAKGARTAVATLKLAPVTSIRRPAGFLSEDCRASVDSLEYLLRLARQNLLPGLMFVALRTNPGDADLPRTVISEISGEAAKEQVIAMLGMLSLLQKDLLRLSES